MKITETVERECCQDRDLKPLPYTGGGMRNEFMFCPHCGRHHELRTVRDAAGSSDREYRPLPWPWQKAGEAGT